MNRVDIIAPHFDNPLALNTNYSGGGKRKTRKRNKTSKKIKKSKIKK